MGGLTENMVGIYVRGEAVRVITSQYSITPSKESRPEAVPRISVVHPSARLGLGLAFKFIYINMAY